MSGTMARTGIGDACQNGDIATLLNSLSFVFKIQFVPKLRVKYDYCKVVTHSLIWRPSRVADTPPLLPISRYGHCLFVADVCLCSEVLQPGGSWSSSGSGSM